MVRKAGPPTDALEVLPPLPLRLPTSVDPIRNIMVMSGFKWEVPHRQVGIIEEHLPILRVPMHDGLGLIGACAIEVHRGSDGHPREGPLGEVLPGDAWRSLLRALVVVMPASDALHLLVRPRTTAMRLRGATGWKHEAPRKLMDN